MSCQTTHGTSSNSSKKSTNSPLMRRSSNPKPPVFGKLNIARSNWKMKLPNSNRRTACNGSALQNYITNPQAARQAKLPSHPRELQRAPPTIGLCDFQCMLHRLIMLSGSWLQLQCGVENADFVRVCVRILLHLVSPIKNLHKWCGDRNKNAILEQFVASTAVLH